MIQTIKVHSVFDVEDDKGVISGMSYCKNKRKASISFSKKVQPVGVYNWEFDKCKYDMNGVYTEQDWIFLGEISKFIQDRLAEFKKK